MTEAPPPDPGAAEALDPPTAPGIELPAVGTGARAMRRRRQSRDRQLRRAGFAAALTVLALAIPVLGYVGFRAVLTSKEGRVVDPVLDPHEPGYEAVVEPTPVALVAHVATPEVDPNADDDIPARQLVGLSVLTLGPGDVGGGVVLVPVHTLTGATARFGFDDLAGAFVVGGLDGLRQATANVVGTSLSEAVMVDDERWTELVAPVAPVEVANPDTVLDPDAPEGGGPAFPAGPLPIDASEVGRYLRLQNPGESALALLARQQLFWEGWLDAIGRAGDGAAAVPGEGGGGLARFVRGLGAAGPVIETLPVRQASPSSPVGGTGDAVEAFDPVEADVSELMARLVPFPTAANPGDRLRLRVLDGTGSDGAALVAARRLVLGGAEIVVVGNADRFDHATTEVRYPVELEDRARDVVESLGAGELVPQRAGSDTVDLTVVVGGDLLQVDDEEQRSG